MIPNSYQGILNVRGFYIELFVGLTCTWHRLDRSNFVLMTSNWRPKHVSLPINNSAMTQRYWLTGLNLILKTTSTHSDTINILIIQNESFQTTTTEMEYFER